MSNVIQDRTVILEHVTKLQLTHPLLAGSITRDAYYKVSFFIDETKVYESTVSRHTQSKEDMNKAIESMLEDVLDQLEYTDFCLHEPAESLDVLDSTGNTVELDTDIKAVQEKQYSDLAAFIEEGYEMHFIK